MGKRNKLSQKRNQALGKKAMLEERFRLISELKESNAAEKTSVPLIGHQQSKSNESTIEQIKAKLASNIQLNAEELQRWKHQERYERQKETFALDQQELERVGAVLAQEQDDYCEEESTEQEEVGGDENQANAQNKEKEPETLDYLHHPEIEQWAEETWDTYPETAFASGPGLDLPQVSLPISELREDLRHYVQQSDTVAIATSTGTGKSTQVPKYFLEMSYGVARPFYRGRILVTEPRRIAASGCCKRVQEEVRAEHAQKIGYAVRGSAENASALVCYVTEGVLLQMLQDDFMLSGVSVIILDEVHERSQAMDVLIGALVTLVRHRRSRFNEMLEQSLKTSPESCIEELEKKCTITPLKLLFMSATLDQQGILDAKQLFPRRPPSLELPKKMFPVAIHMEARQHADYVEAAADKVAHIHENSGAGGILVFLTGQGEINQCVSLLQERFNSVPAKCANDAVDEDLADGADDTINAAIGIAEVNQKVDQVEEKYTDNELHTIECPGLISPEQIALLRAEYDAMHEAPVETDEQKKPEKKRFVPVILPLHGQLSLDEQRRIFDPILETQRLIIVATNVAESSLTIPAVKYVVDACRQKVKIAMQSGCRLAVQFSSQANLTQRAGRAGRVCPGHCFRLLTPGQISRLQQQPEPEMVRLPLEGVVLQLLRMGVRDPAHFPFPAYPGASRIRDTLECLHGANCIVRTRDSKKEIRMTEFGTCVQGIPLDFRQAVIMALGLGSSCGVYAALLSAALSIEGLLRFENTAGLPVKVGKGDILDLLFTAGALEYFKTTQEKKLFCEKHFLRVQAWEEVHKLFQQLVRKFNVEGQLGKPSRMQQSELSKIIVQSGLNKIAFLQEEDGRYGISPINVLDFIQEDEADDDIRKNNTLDSARLSKTSTINAVQPQPDCVSYFKVNVALLEVEIEGKICKKPAAFLNDCHPFPKAMLMEFAEFSPYITVENQQAPFWEEDQLKCVADCYYDDLHRRVLLGKQTVLFPGRSFCVRNAETLIALEKAKATAICLLKGEILPDLKQFAKDLLHSIRTATEAKTARIGKQMQHIDAIAQFFVQKSVTNGRTLCMGIRQNPAHFKTLLLQCYQKNGDDVWQALISSLTRFK